MGKGGKLKGALGSYQAAAAKKAAEAKRAANAKAKANAPQMNEKAKRAAKRQRREREAAEAAARAEARNAKDKAAAARASAGAASASAAESSNAVLRKATIPIKPDDTVLLLGEANFSFALALVKGRGHSGHLVCATSYDSEAQCYEKYPDGKDNVIALREAGVRVVFNVDAGALEKSKAIGKGRRWSRVVFNFPHCGSGMTDQNRNIRENQVMLLRSLRSVAGVLSDGPPEVEEKKRKRKPQESDSESEDEDGLDGFEDDDEDMPKTKGYAPSSFTTPNRQGSFLITLLSQPPYSLWDIKGLATRPPPVCPGTREAQPRYTLKRSFEFVPAVWPGYAHRRTIGWREGLSKDDNEEIVGRIGKARTWEFVLREEEE